MEQVTVPCIILYVCNEDRVRAMESYKKLFAIKLQRAFYIQREDFLVKSIR